MLDIVHITIVVNSHINFKTVFTEAGSALDNEGTDAASSDTALNCILITTDNESLAYLLDSYGMFKKVRQLQGPKLLLCSHHPYNSMSTYACSIITS